MPYSTFTPLVSPAPGTSRTSKIRTNMNDFGDQYSQSIPDGINTIENDVSLQWNVLSASEKNAIITFFASQNSSPFYYTLPDDASTGLYRCTEWDEQFIGLSKFSLTAQLRRVYG